MGFYIIVIAICAAGFAAADETSDIRCLWKPCQADEGQGCYKVRQTEGPSVTSECEEGLIFNSLSCVFHNESNVCVTEDFLVQEALKIDSVYNKSLGCSGEGWKGPMGQSCFKRFGNRNLKTCPQCKDNCPSLLKDAEIAELDSIAKNVYVRELGAPDNKYWVGIELNEAGDGWTWVNDGTPLTADQALFDISLAEMIEDLQAANGGTIDRTQSCVLQEHGSLSIPGISVPLNFVWRVVSCDYESQCMCQADAKLEMCSWKACEAKKGPECYKVRVRGEWRRGRCENEGEIFNPLVCATQDPNDVCITETELQERASDLLGEISVSNYCRGKSWKGPIGGNCYKRLGNANKKTFDECETSCENQLHVSARMAEMTTVARNVFARQMGHKFNKYWIGLVLNSDGDGWTWLSNGEALTEDEAMFEGTIEEEIAALRAANDGVITANDACIMSVDGSYFGHTLSDGEALPFEWKVGSCDVATQCLCEKEAERE